MARVRRLARPRPSPFTPLRRPELLHREHRAAREHVKDRSPNLVGQDREGLSFAVLLLDPRQNLLAVLRVAQEQHGRFGERPFQMHNAKSTSMLFRTLASANCALAPSRLAGYARRRAKAGMLYWARVF